MKELIEALEQILQKGIVVEHIKPQRADYLSGVTPAFRIRLADQRDEEPERPQQSQRGW